MKNSTEIATFAAGCFWGVEAVFRQVKGVIDVLVGYAGGTTENPTYEEVCSGNTGHAESVQVTFDPKVVSYNDLLFVFWENHDPTTLDKQGPDVGSQYRSAIFYRNDKQKQEAQESREAFAASGNYKDPIVTEIVPLAAFYKAEEYHQQYFEKKKGAAPYL